MAEQKKEKLNAMQFLKFLAFLMIFTYHARGNVGCEKVIGYGVEGTSFFILCSGLTTAYSRVDGDSCKWSLTAVWKELRGKLKKFYPLYFATTVYAIFMTDIPRFVSEHYYEGLKPLCIQLLKHLLLIQPWFNDGLCFSFNPVCWFFAVMIFLYCFNIPLVGLMRKMVTSRRKVLTGMACTALLSVLSNIAVYYVNKNDFWRYVFPPMRLSEYVLGMFMGTFIYGVRNSEYRFDKKWCTAAEIISLLLWAGYIFMPITNWGNLSVHWIVPNACVLFTFALGKGKLSDLFCRCVPRRLGSITTECYFIHFVLISTCAWLSGLSELSRLGNLFMFLSTLGLTIVLSLLMHGSKDFDRKTAE